MQSKVLHDVGLGGDFNTDLNFVENLLGVVLAIIPDQVVGLASAILLIKGFADNRAFHVVFYIQNLNKSLMFLECSESDSCAIFAKF